jgi:hypothetical protein
VVFINLSKDTDVITVALGVGIVIEPPYEPTVGVPDIVGLVAVI